MHGFVVGHFQSVRRYHAVKGQLAGQTVIQVAVRLFLRIDFFAQREFLNLFLLHFLSRSVTSVFFGGLVFLRLGRYDAHKQGEHHNYFFHFTLDLVVIIN